jgi:hypothetical protein
LQCTSQVKKYFAAWESFISATSFPSLLMPTLAESFSDDLIISHLCKERVKLAEFRSDRQYISRLVGNTPEAEPDRLLYQILGSSTFVMGKRV